MCILCVIQKWSRRVATMLPWLVIPLIGLWALSQLLPPPYRFEITSPRLACVFVLLVTLVWYQYLMPYLSAWRVRRTARLREKKRFEALELQKLRKTATRRCRNCLTPYRDQNPGGGKFMCSYCGHISKRPVLDLPIPPGLGISNSSIMKELLGKGGKILNGRVWSDNSSICRVWLDHGSSVVNGMFPGKFTYSSKRSGAGAGCFGGDEQYLDEKLYPHSHSFPRMWMNAFLKSIRWIWRKLFSVSSSREDASSDADHRGVSAKRGEIGLHYQESRGEKARRKAEEKRQARLEKELLEEEERKQREEVARMVEERRRLRDEKIEAENRARGSCQREKEKKEAEKRRQERKREKDKCSSKSNSDVDEVEKKIGRETEWKRDTDKKMEIERRDYHRNGTDTVKGQGAETGNGGKGSPVNNFGRGNAGTRYFDRMRGTLLSSSKAFTGGSFFGKTARTPAPATKDRHNSFVDHFHGSVSKREICPPDRVPVKLSMNGDERSTNRPVVSEPQHKTAPKSWQQLFTQSPAAPPSTANVIGRPNVKTRPEAQSPQPPSQSSSPPTYDNPINFGFSLPFTLPTFSNGSMNVSSSLAAKDHIFLHAGEVSHDPLPEEPELFEDPCYVPDPVSLLGPVSESLDNFQLDLGTGFMTKEKEKPCSFVNSSAPLDTSRRSPIESPISRVRVSDDKQNHTSRLPCSPRAQDVHPFAAAEFNNVNENGTWQMWNTSPLVQDGLGYLGNHANWVSPLDWSRPYKDDGIHSAPHKTMASLFANDSQPTSGALSPQKIFLGNGQNGSAFGSSISSQSDDSWLQKAFPASFSLGEDHFPVKPKDDASQKKLVYGSPGRAATNHSFDISQANCWPKSESAIMQGSDEGVGNPSVVKPNVGGGLYSTSDVQSLWSFE